MYSNLWFSNVICSATILISALLIPEAKDFNIDL